MDGLGVADHGGERVASRGRGAILVRLFLRHGQVSINEREDRSNAPNLVDGRLDVARISWHPADASAGLADSRRCGPVCSIAQGGFDGLPGGADRRFYEFRKAG